MKRFVLVALMAVGLALAPRAANAAIVIDFEKGLNPSGGVFTLLSGGNASGLNIPIGALTFDNNGVSTVYAMTGLLSFNTVTNFIQIIGGVPALNISAGTTLLSGTFISWVANSNGLTNAIGPDTKDPGLLRALGLPTNTPFAYFGFTLTSGNLITGQTNQWTVISTDIRNTAVPEPGSMFLLGSGLLGLAAIVRRRMRRA